MFKKNQREKLREKRKARIRAKVFGTKDIPRVSVFRSSRHIYTQIVDDVKGKTVIAASDLELDSKDKTNKKRKAYEVGKLLAKKALKKKIKKVVFDRGGYKYHGRIKELARGAREGGLKF